MNELVLSSLGHTWIFDLDGTVAKHNGYKTQGFDTLVKGAAEFFKAIPKSDMIIFVTSRKKKFKKQTENFLLKNRIRYDHIIFEAPLGERILINDQKPGGLKTAIAINPKRDKWKIKKIVIEN